MSVNSCLYEAFFQGFTFFRMKGPQGKDAGVKLDAGQRWLGLGAPVVGCLFMNSFVLSYME